MSINPKIFKTYDIRGKVGDDLTAQSAMTIGRALGTHLQRQYDLSEVLVGYDMRDSSQDLLNKLLEGLHSTGCATYNIGLVATPVLYWSAYRTGMAGVMITASHLGKEFNGFKMVVGRRAIFGQEIQAIRERIEVGDFETGPGKSYEILDVNASYLSYLANCFRPVRKLKVVVDAGNGMGGIYAPDLLHRLGHEVEALYCDPDGSFPNHHPNPEKPANVADLASKVREIGADVGLAFDGDADRVGVVDETGQLISADKIMAWLARDIVPRNPGMKFVGDVLSSQVVFDVVEQHGGQSILWQSGHARVKSKMQAEGAILGGESSGHMFFGDRYFGFDDGVYSAGRVVELLAEGQQPLSAHLADLPAMFTTPEYRPHCPEEQKTRVIEGVKALLGDVPMVDVDGLRVLFPDGWGLLRPSGTEPVLSLRFEARSEADAWAYKERIVGLVKQVYPDVEDF
ncbi:MAG: phosphomannomutase/phosphoglucomutase [Chloroflexi bacterium]|nr:phosphomannomutase/phosphoglucomutase [Chloroflexota bacterium]